MDYKDTLNLPKTDFPMRANLSQREPQILERWEDLDLYRKIRDQRSGSLPFILHDGPPYANGNIHIGHALNKILKDFIVKSKTMEGRYSPYIPGWDCHGLPIEYQVLKKLGKDRKGMDSLDVRRACREYAKKFVEIQKEEFKRLGVLGDWENPYLTMTPEYEAAIVRSFASVVEAGGVYKGKKPVLWCPFDATALAEAEVEYADHTSPSIYVKFPFRERADENLLDIFKNSGPVFDQNLMRQLMGRKLSIVIWTTTPWTLVSNRAVCLHPELEYALYISGGEAVIVARGCIDRFLKDTEFNQSFGTTVCVFKGAKIEGWKFGHPWLDQESPIVLAEHVTLEQGTGCVHTAPGHGQEDYEVGLKYGLEVYAPIDHRGRFLDEVDFYAGQKVFESNIKIIQHLKDKGLLLKEESLVHSYPHCWRCKNPVIYRATEQWFISMEVKQLRQKALDEIEKVQWVPKWGKDRIYGMIKNRPDWCISRQRVWGVPIVAFTCQGCGETLISAEVIRHVADIMEQGEGSDVWFSMAVEALLPSGTQCSQCQGKEFKKEKDILDVWFESGVSHYAVLKARPELQWPADLYLEGSDQHRGWFHSALLTGLQIDNKAPYKAVLTHGFVMDGNGRKMSKSAGNVVAPQKIIDKYGAEILRLWVASIDFREDVRISPEILTQLVEIYRKIRNTCRFLLGNLYDFDPDKDRIHQEAFLEIDWWAMKRMQQLLEKVQNGYAHYEFHSVIHSLNYFCAVDMSAIYLDIIKDRLYIFAPQSPERKAAQQVLYEILISLTKLMAPILSFTAEEIWAALPGKKEVDSVFLSRFPEQPKIPHDVASSSQWEKLLQIREDVSKVLEVSRKKKKIGQSLEASVKLYAEGKLLEFLQTHQKDFPTLFIVSTVEIFQNSEREASPLTYSELQSAPSDSDGQAEMCTGEIMKDLTIWVKKSEHQKCQRCWMYVPSVGRGSLHRDLCSRCSSIL